MKRPKLEFFNRLRGTLRIEPTEPPQRFAPHMLNLKAPEMATIKSIRLEMGVFNVVGRRELTEAELALIVFDQPEIRLRGESGDCILHKAPNGRQFTVRDLIEAVESTERQTRGKTRWLGGGGRCSPRLLRGARTRRGRIVGDLLGIMT